jgi:hypothetical protein
MLWITTWRWGRKYDGHYVERLKAGIARHLKQECKFALFAPYEEDEYLTKIPGCFCRLRMFSREWQEAHGIEEGDRIVLVDLDVVITGPLDELFDRDEDFVILQGANASNPCPFNGSLQMLKAGKHENVWKDFSLKRAGEVPYFEFPDDQAWLADRVPDAAGWKAGPESGVYAFKKPGWPAGDDLPKDARLVAFPGWRDPSKFTHLEWVKKNWAA